MHEMHNHVHVIEREIEFVDLPPLFKKNRIAVCILLESTGLIVNCSIARYLLVDFALSFVIVFFSPTLWALSGRNGVQFLFVFRFISYFFCSVYHVVWHGQEESCKACSNGV